jgi:hypothetical protein
MLLLLQYVKREIVAQFAADALNRSKPAVGGLRSNLAQIKGFPYNRPSISSHVTGEKTGSARIQKIASAFGKRWASTGKREISSAVRLGSPNGKYD